MIVKALAWIASIAGSVIAIAGLLRGVLADPSTPSSAIFEDGPAEFQ